MDERMICRSPLRESAEANAGGIALRRMRGGFVEELTYTDLLEIVDHRSEWFRDRHPDLRRAGLRIDDPAELLVSTWALFELGVEVCLIPERLPAPVALDLCRVTGTRDVFWKDDDLSYIRVYEDETRANARERRGVASFGESGTIVFTSGSSGAPKGVLHRVEAHVYSALGSQANIRLAPGDAWLVALPQYHVSGLAIPFRCFIAGAAVALPDPSADIAESVVRLDASHASMVHTQLRRFLDSFGPTQSTHPLKILMGGGPLPIRELERARDAGCVVFASYGLTEMASQVTTTNGSGETAELRTAGRSLPYREIRIGSNGAIEVRGRTRFEGYLTASGLERPFDEDGWFTTGDFGSFDAEGRLRVGGRSDRVFITGGENVNPQQVEHEILRHPGMKRAAVVPVDDEEFGARPVAFVDPHVAGDTEDQLRSALRSRLPSYAVPTLFLPFPSTVETAISKVDYTRLRDIADSAIQSKKSVEE